ncbi:SIS domain-containing protein [Kitasatospora sp. NPDC002227]|uniref:SIS domain-containing protein n=1 Tax=Kitasatospora sp. NPDC002227 TaxID=3154773 RepID=UPI00332DAE13
MIDDSLLDDPAALQRADHEHALLGLAGAGARVRNALRLAEAAGLAGLRPDGRPRTVLVAGHGAALTAGSVLEALAVTSTQIAALPPHDVTHLAHGHHGTPAFTAGLVWQLPGWAGPLDLVVLATADGGEQGLVSLAQQAYARGCAIAVIAPAESLLAEAAPQVRALPLPYVPAAPVDTEEDLRPAEADLPAEEVGALWAFLTPLLALTERIGVTQLPEGSLEATADRLDELAVRCRPDAAAYTNPAKDLAAQLSGTVPLLWADGALTAVAAERFAAMLAERAGRPALPGVLPQVLTAHRGMLVAKLGGAADPDDFFRDRVDEPDPLLLQVVLLRRAAAVEDEFTDPGYAVSRARRLADAHGVRTSDLSTAETDPLQALAELIALADFAAVYLTLATP